MIPMRTTSQRTGTRMTDLTQLRELSGASKLCVFVLTVDCIVRRPCLGCGRKLDEDEVASGLWLLHALMKMQLLACESAREGTKCIACRAVEASARERSI